MVTNTPANSGDLRGAGWISGLDLQVGSPDPLEKEMATHSSIFLENPMHRGTSWATVHGDAKSQTLLKRLHFTSLHFSHLKLSLPKLANENKRVEKE